MYKAAT